MAEWYTEHTVAPIISHPLLDCKIKWKETWSKAVMLLIDSYLNLLEG